MFLLILLNGQRVANNSLTNKTVSMSSISAKDQAAKTLKVKNVDNERWCRIGLPKLLVSFSVSTSFATQFIEATSRSWLLASKNTEMLTNSFRLESSYDSHSQHLYVKEVLTYMQSIVINLKLSLSVVYLLIADTGHLLVLVVQANW